MKPMSLKSIIALFIMVFIVLLQGIPIVDAASSTIEDNVYLKIRGGLWRFHIVVYNFGDEPVTAYFNISFKSKITGEYDNITHASMVCHPRFRTEFRTNTLYSFATVHVNLTAGDKTLVKTGFVICKIIIFPPHSILKSI